MSLNKRVTRLLAMLCLLLVGVTSAFAQAGPKVLVLYDSTGQYGWIGDLYQQHLTNLLSHFNARVTREKVEEYKEGQIGNYNFTFYIGAVYDNPLPQAFLDDMVGTTQPVCWMGYNLWQLAWNAEGYNPYFESRYGVRYLGLDVANSYQRVVYKNVPLLRQGDGNLLGMTQLLPGSSATVQAIARTGTGISNPYIVKANNLWIVNDNPMQFVGENDRNLAFADLMHGMLGINHVEEHRAVIRIEDVSPHVPAATLRAIADTLYAESVPFAVCVIPKYRDPQGVYSKGVRETITMDEAPEFVEALKYMQSKGGQIVLHGFTHQEGSAPNPYHGVSAEDYEFYNVTLDSNGNQIWHGFVPEDSAEWAAGRVNAGKQMLARAGLTAVGWNTPHYYASPTDFAEFAKVYKTFFGRGQYYSVGKDGKNYYQQQMAPFLIPKDTYGVRRIPDTIGYMNPGGELGVARTTPAILADRAAANLVVRDGWAGCYFHWFLSTTLLKKLVQGIKAKGYTFIPITPTTK